MTENERRIYSLGLQKQAELDADASKGALSPQQVAEAISKVASVDEMGMSDVTEKVAALAFDAAYGGDFAKTASIINCLG